MSQWSGTHAILLRQREVLENATNKETVVWWRSYRATTQWKCVEQVAVTIPRVFLPPCKRGERLTNDAETTLAFTDRVNVRPLFFA